MFQVCPQKRNIINERSTTGAVENIMMCLILAAQQISVNVFSPDGKSDVEQHHPPPQYVGKQLGNL